MQAIKNFHDTRARIFQRFTEARQPKREWNLFSEDEKARRLNEQQEQARQAARVDVERIGRDLRNELQAVRQKFEKGLRPFQFSDLQSERHLGYYFEGRAHRFVQSVKGDVGRVTAEYAWAAQNNLLDYATELLAWWETLTPDNAIATRVEVDRLKKQHVDTLKLNELNKSLSMLNDTLKEFEGLAQQLEAGVDKTTNEAGSFEEWQEIAALQGLLKV